MSAGSFRRAAKLGRSARPKLNDRFQERLGGSVTADTGRLADMRRRAPAIGRKRADRFKVTGWQKPPFSFRAIADVQPMSAFDPLRTLRFSTSHGTIRVEGPSCSLQLHVADCSLAGLPSLLRPEAMPHPARLAGRTSCSSWPMTSATQTCPVTDNPTSKRRTSTRSLVRVCALLRPMRTAPSAPRHAPP